MDGHEAPFRVSAKRQAVLLPYDARVGGVIPHAQVLNKAGRQYHVVPHRHTETKLLKHFGYNIPAPILYQYDWSNTTPFDSQRVTAAMMTEHRRAYVLNDMGTGKTRAALYACDFLMKMGEATRALIVAPLSTLSSVWDHEVFQCFPHRNTSVLYGTKKKRLQALAEDAHFYIINTDGVKVIADTLAERQDIDVVILDELALYRNSRSQLWKTTNRICKPRKFVWGMTGSPIPKAPTDAYAQIKLLTPERAPKFFKEFQSQTMYQVSQFRWLARKEAKEIVYKAMQPSVRYARADCVDLPPTTYTTHDVELTKEQKNSYNEMYKEMNLVINDPSFAGSITASNAGVQLSKLIQIGAGFVYGKDLGKGRPQINFDAKHRVALVEQIIEAASGKVIVFAPFVAAVDALYETLTKKSHAPYHGALGVAKIHGATSKTDRDRIFTEFQHSHLPRVLVAHPGTMSHGLTLTAADTIVWYSPVFSLETYEQANARITRPGQKLHTHIVHIQASAVERRIYNTLQKRGNMQAELLALFRGGGI